MKALSKLALLLSTAPTALSTTLIPRTVFDSTASLEQYFTYNYPWGGNTHNGPSLPPSYLPPISNTPQAVPAWTKPTSSPLPASSP
jgi:hypothetical protein